VGTRMVSLRVEEGLLEWATGYAKQREVSRSALMEAALRSLRDDAVRGVPEIEDERVPRPVPKPTPPPAVVPAVKALQRSQQSEMAMARMRRINPQRYG
jgi:hypothetical protein